MTVYINKNFRTKRLNKERGRRTRNVYLLNLFCCVTFMAM